MSNEMNFVNLRVASRFVIRCCVVAISSVTLGLSSGCAIPGRVDTSAVRSIGQRALDRGIVGLSIGIAHHDRVVFAEGFGFSDLERRRRATEETIYDIASVGKQFTSAAVMRLIERGQLDPSARIRELVPGTPDHFPDATVDQLLHHTSGFVSGTLDELDPPPGLDQPMSSRRLLEDVALVTGKVGFRPGEHWVYSNSGYLLLGLVVESVSGQPYAQYVREQLLDPLELRDTTVCQRPTGDRMSDALRVSDAGVARVPFIHMSVYAGQGSICSSVTDLLAWEVGLHTGKVMSEASLREFRAPGELRGSRSTAVSPYGMAQRLGSLHGHAKVGHTGTFDGGSAVLTHYPELGLTIAVLVNTRGSGLPHAAAIEADVAELWMDSTSTVDHEPRAVPAALRASIAGSYTDGRHDYAAWFDEDLLVATRGGREVGRFTYAGEMEFRAVNQPRNREWFVKDGDRIGWWMYEVNGLLMGAFRRVED